MMKDRGRGGPSRGTGVHLEDGEREPAPGTEVGGAAERQLGAMLGNVGDQSYDVPGDIDLTKYRSVSICCRRFSVNFAVKKGENSADGATLKRLCDHDLEPVVPTPGSATHRCVPRRINNRPRSFGIST